MAFNTFSLGQVLQQGEAIKGMKRQGITDQLQQQYLTQNIKAGETAATNVAADREAKLGKDKATQVFTTMQYALQSPDPSAFVEQNAPELIQELSKNGINWQQVDQPTRLKMLQGIMAKAGAEIGQGPAAKPVQMETIQGPDGALLQRDPATGALKEILGRKPRDPAPEKGPTAPAGYRYKADGSLEPIPGGPADTSKPKAPGEAILKQKEGIKNLGIAVDEYIAKLPNFGILDQLSPDARAEIGNVYNNMMLQAKEAYNLGVLNGPDYSILQKVVTDPATFKGAITSNKALANQAKELKRITQKMAKTPLNASGADGSTKKAPPQAEDYLRANPQFKAAFKEKYGYLPDGL